MSGAEASLVLGLISSVIAIIEAAKEVYDAANDAKGLPKAFRTAAETIPMWVSTMSLAEKNIRAKNVGSDTLKNVTPILQRCRNNADALKDIFDKHIPSKDPSIPERYSKAIKFSFKSSKVEEYVEQVEKDLNLLGQYQVFQTGDTMEDIKGTVENIKGAVENTKVAEDEEKNSQCLRSLRQTDPRDEKKRIERSKDKLLDGSCDWVFEDASFCTWWNAQGSHLLWINGDPGKGKTMIAVAAIAEISKRVEDSHSGATLAFFFFQSTIPELNTAVGALRGLIYMLVDQNPALVTHVRKRYDNAGDKLFEGHSVLEPLWEILHNIVNDPSLPAVYLLLDALDECTEQQAELLSLVIESGTQPGSKVKWILTSRNEPAIKEQLQSDSVCSNTSLEVNAENVSGAVERYVNARVAELSKQKKYSSTLQQQVTAAMMVKAGGTFLWVALVCKELQSRKGKLSTLSILDGFPTGLRPLYRRMMEQIEQGISEQESGYCINILSFLTAALRPVSIYEVGYMAGVPDDVAADSSSMEELVEHCGSFLILREGTIYFIHQSAKDFFINKGDARVLASGLADQHYTAFRRSYQLMSETLRRDICGLEEPGVLLDEVEEHVNRSFPAKIRYPCAHWVQHAGQALSSHGDERAIVSEIKTFLNSHLLHWLEAVSLIRRMSETAALIKRLEHAISRRGADDNPLLLSNIASFVLENRYIIERAPLQVYVSALVFSPRGIKIKEFFQVDSPRWVRSITGIKDDLTACIQTLEGHLDLVTDIAFSPDSKLVVSSSSDCTVKLWDVNTGELKHTLGEHLEAWSVAFSPHSDLIASASLSGTVKLWDAATGKAYGHCLHHMGGVCHVVFSPDGNLIASASMDGTVHLWEASTGVHRFTLGDSVKGDSQWDIKAVFSSDGSVLASISDNKKIVKLWNPATGLSLGAIDAELVGATAFAFAAESRVLASLHYNNVVKLFKVASERVCVGCIKLERSAILKEVLAFCPQGKLLAIASTTGTVKLWDVTTGQIQCTLRKPLGNVDKVLFSPDGLLLATLSLSSTIMLWDTATGAHISTFENAVDNWDLVFMLGSGLLATVSGPTIRLWDTTRPITPPSASMVQKHSDYVVAVAIAPSGQRLASSSSDNTVKLWDSNTGELLKTFDGQGFAFIAVCFSADGTLLASSWGTICIVWNTDTMQVHCKLVGHLREVNAISFSPDGKVIATVSSDYTVALWDVKTGARKAELSGHRSRVSAVVFSPDGTLVAATSYNGRVKMWDVRKQRLVESFSVKSRVRSTHLDFSDDAKFLILSNDLRPVEYMLQLKTKVTPRWPSSNSLSVTDDWVCYGGKRILWLPVDYRPYMGCLAILHNLVAIGTRSGRVISVLFDEEELTRFFKVRSPLVQVLEPDELIDDSGVWSAQKTYVEASTLGTHYSGQVTGL